MKKIELKKGVFIIPSLFTVSNLFFGFSCMVLAQRGDYRMAGIMIFIAGLMDMLDGRIARLTGTESHFGAELDSIVDMVSFGVAPAFLVYHWAFTGTDLNTFPIIPRLGWAAAFLFLTCGALRLARFNIQKGKVSSRYFVGLPIPAGAALIASIVLRFPNGVNLPFFSYLVFALVVFTALMMVSRARYRSFKDVDLKSKASSTVMVAIAIVIMGILVTPSTVLSLAFGLYLIHPFGNRLFIPTTTQLNTKEAPSSDDD
ncbi:MAG: CDP-diacylglycerol--serine O-phosphatidyltransferase [Holophagae bacterium]|nr:CDP-diacylglycerol--serine O-phosphatidyltransferase [Holophagae bacterium]